MKSEVITAVETLNERIYYVDELPSIVFEYRTCGYCEYITYGDLYIWDSDNDDRIWKSETEPETLVEFCLRELSKHVDMLNAIINQDE